MKTNTSVSIMLLIALLGLLVGAHGCEKKSEAWIARQAFQAASQYANSISCETSTDIKYLVALAPWKAPYKEDEQRDAVYALIWHGDIGCEGGSGTVNPNIAIVRISTGDSFVVDPFLSSPMIDFQVPVHSIKNIIKVAKTELILSALDWGPEDPHCCPTVPVHIFLRQDGKGNWKLIEKKRVSPSL